ncbi:MAG: hypothetical protein NUV61_01125 [Candidatus Azambacteria bacterium]|nr:hypothetical protein [Candidatus Azambacteria bacterium]
MPQDEGVIQIERVGDDATREDRISALITYYLAVLSEDKQGESDFDTDVLRALKKLQEKHFDKNKKRVVGTHSECGGNIIRRNQCRWCDKCKEYFCGCACG